jgi:hypothetical protein
MLILRNFEEYKKASRIKIFWKLIYESIKIKKKTKGNNAKSGGNYFSARDHNL